MTKEEVAAALNGLSHRQEPAAALREHAADAGLVIVFGASDDLLEIRGAIMEEYGASDGKEFWFTQEGVFDPDACYEECCYYREARDKAQQEGAKLTALWFQEEPYSWTYCTTIPHATFEVLESDGKPYCRGIVFALEDVGKT